MIPKDQWFGYQIPKAGPGTFEREGGFDMMEWVAWETTQLRADGPKVWRCFFRFNSAPPVILDEPRFRELEIRWKEFNQKFRDNETPLTASHNTTGDRMSEVASGVADPESVARVYPD